MSTSPLATAPLPPPRRLRRAPRSALRLVSPRAGEVLVGVVTRTTLADIYDSLAQVETCPARREALTLWAASARGGR